MRCHADALATRMAGHCHCTVSLASSDDICQRQMDVAEVESLLQFWGYAKDQHMAVFGLDLGTFQNSQAILFTQRTVCLLYTSPSPRDED